MFKDPQRCTFVKLPENSITKTEDRQQQKTRGWVCSRRELKASKAFNPLATKHVSSSWSRKDPGNRPLVPLQRSGTLEVQTVQPFLFCHTTPPRKNSWGPRLQSPDLPRHVASQPHPLDPCCCRGSVCTHPTRPTAHARRAIRLEKLFVENVFISVGFLRVHSGKKMVPVEMDPLLVDPKRKTYPFETM